jgi:hypothetical protein
MSAAAGIVPLLSQASAPSAEPSDPYPSGRPSKRDDPGPVNPRQSLTKQQVKEIREKKEKLVKREARIGEAGAVAGRDLSAAQVGVVRTSLFDADDWRKEHNARQQRMESTFTRLYKPQAGAYWTQKQKAPPKKPPPGQLPAYNRDLPAALSLQHPSSREQPSDDDDLLDDDDEAAEGGVREGAGAEEADPLAAFDPMAEPKRFYAEFKGRVASLRVGVKDNPTERPGVAATQPRRADAVVAEATRKSPPPQPPPQPPPKVEAANTWSLTGGAPSRPGGGLTTASHPILDEDFDFEPSLVYTDSAHYLADHGVSIPMWDELDAELAACDAAHADAMRALAMRDDKKSGGAPTITTRGGAGTTGGAGGGSV